MTDATHGLSHVVTTTNSGRPIVVCLCGCISSGKPGLVWTVTDHGDGTLTYSPSFDWPGHFHVIAERVRSGDIPDTWDGDVTGNCTAI